MKCLIAKKLGQCAKTGITTQEVISFQALPNIQKNELPIPLQYKQTTKFQPLGQTNLR